ncbi:MAG: InlB B-repeat-containing protein [Clostridia bacterium]|nr:InlB B-repeat-containing protein [Clostridia bacterium]
MKKVLIKSLVFTLSVFALLLVSGCGVIGDCIGCGMIACLNSVSTDKVGSKMQSGDFVYCYLDSSDRTYMAKEGDSVAILEVSNLGKNKKTLIIPEQIDGKDVIQIGLQVSDYVGVNNEYQLSTEGCQYNKVILPKTIKYIMRWVNLTYGIKCIIKDFENFDIIPARSYLSRPLYERYYAGGGLSGSLQIANVEYISDGEIYFVDDYDKGELIEIPPEPTKEGYMFEGWYTEQEYVNKWNFEENTFTLEEGQTVKSFYAKFEKINK